MRERAVRVVAVGALHLAFDDRVMRRLEDRVADRLVAGAADVGFVHPGRRRERRDDRVARLAVNVVAVVESKPPGTLLSGGLICNRLCQRMIIWHAQLANPWLRRDWRRNKNSGWIIGQGLS